MTDDKIRGMKISEAVDRASKWWDGTARKEMAHHLAREGAMASKDPESANFLPSGIIHGLPFADLGRREQGAIVKAWLDAYHPRDVN